MSNESPTDPADSPPAPGDTPSAGSVADDFVSALSSDGGSTSAAGQAPVGSPSSAGAPAAPATWPKPHLWAQVIAFVVVAALLVFTAIKCSSNASSSVQRAEDSATKARGDADTRVRQAEEAAAQAKREADEAKRAVDAKASDKIDVGLSNVVSDILRHEQGNVTVQVTVNAHKPGKKAEAAPSPTSASTDPVDPPVARPVSPAPPPVAPPERTWADLMDENQKRIARTHGIDPSSMKPADLQIIRLAQKVEELEAKAKVEGSWKEDLARSQAKLAEIEARLRSSDDASAASPELQAQLKAALHEVEDLKGKAAEAERARIRAEAEADTLRGLLPKAPSTPAPSADTTPAVPPK